jgi:glycosyltransferase involved in cell wall biosynthesis
MKNNWSKRQAVLILHEANTGPGHDLRDYLLKKNISELLFISHPLILVESDRKKSSYYIYYKKGKVVKKYNSSSLNLPMPLLYIKDLIYSVFWTTTQIKRTDMVIGFGNLNAYAGLLLKWIGVSRKNIFYVIDYIPKRFANNIVNSIYHKIEKIAAEKSDTTWNLSPRMITAREDKWKKSFLNQLVVPHGVHIERIKHVPFSKVNKTEILYMGTILQKQGIQLVLKTIQIVAKKIPSLKFTIIGRGPYEPELHALTKELKIEKYVSFLGYIESHEEMEDRIAKAGIAVALYNKEYDQFSYYADPGKIKNYLGAGVPVIMTDVPYVARQVEEAKCGFIIENNEKSLEKILLNFFTDEKMMKKYRANALKFAEGYAWDLVFDKAFVESNL